VVGKDLKLKVVYIEEVINPLIDSNFYYVCNFKMGKNEYKSTQQVTENKIYLILDILGV
jgi:hypothetical protein